MATRIVMILTVVLIDFSLTVAAWATPSNDLVQALNASVLRVQVSLPDGKIGLGSAVAIGQDEVVTNCHVVGDARNVVVFQHDNPLTAVSIKPDWRHDVCILKVTGLTAPIVKMRASSSLKHEESFFTAGFPDGVTQPVNTFGVVKGLFTMDGGAVIRASSPFRLGASGGGAFDDAGNLVGIITLKNRGEGGQYYYMPVEWVQALMQQPEQALGAAYAKPFWAEDDANKPYFMRVVMPQLKQDWKKLHKVAQRWTEQEPEAAESWFYLALAEYASNDAASAEAHFKKTLALSSDHAEAADYLQKIAQANYQAVAFNASH